MKQLVIFLFIALCIGGTSCKSKKSLPTSDNSEARASNRQERPNRKGPRSIEDIFKMDANNDGQLSKTEVKGRLLNDFAKIDTNADGFLSKEEVENAPKPKRGQRPPRQ